MHNDSLQPATGLKTLLQITLTEVLRNRCKTVPFSLQVCRPEYLTWTQTFWLHENYFLWLSLKQFTSEEIYKEKECNEAISLK